MNSTPDELLRIKTGPEALLELQAALERDPTNPVLQGIPSLPRRTRVTMLSKLYYERYGEQPDYPDHTPHVEFLETEEEVYKRTLTVGEQWTPIDFGWTRETHCSFINVKNAYRPKRDVEPTDNEKEDDASRILEIGKIIPQLSDYVEPVTILYTGQEVTFSPLGPLDRFVIRCRAGSGRYTVFCVPNDPE